MMRTPFLIALLALLSVATVASPQSRQPSFEVVSVRPSQHEAGPDYRNQVTYSPDGFTGQNVTLKRLVAEAWHCQLSQVIGPPWLDHNEYDITARLPDGASTAQIPLMLRSLLSDRFRLKEHDETRQMRVYELTVAQNGPRIHPVQTGNPAAAGPGLHFRGNMRELADLLAIQFAIPAPASPSEPVIGRGPLVPVLDKTELPGIYEFSADLRPEVGTDGLTAWKRILGDQLGLKIDARKTGVPVIVIDDAEKVPTAN